ncbi:MAG: PIN domain-containing protein [Candidatus Thermoplasmatota archaeon]|nr:PIN domain-containing protein [Candidatus Thermoplasmatota archaeon]
MKMVIDSNRIMAGLIKDSQTRKIIFNEEFNFIAPDYVITEIEKYRHYLIEKSKLTDREFDIILLSILERIELIPSDVFIDHLELAEEIMKDIDIKDTPFLALGLAVKASGIWTEDKDFDRQDKLKRFSTKELFNIANKNH